MPLNDSAIKSRAVSKAKPFKLSDGEGLYLLVKPNGSRLWQMSYRFAGKHKTLSFGGYPDVTLKRAREKKVSAKVALERGEDPSDIRRAEKAAEKLAADNTFKVIADEWQRIRLTAASTTHLVRVRGILKNHLNPHIGHRPISKITTADLLVVFRKIEAKLPGETARKAKQISGQIFRYAVQTGRTDRDITQDLSGALRKPISKHHAAITDPDGVSKLLLAIDTYEGTPVVEAALRLAPLVFLRPGTLRRLEWGWVDLEAARIEIPADTEGLKTKESLIVPLAKQAVAILSEIHRHTGSRGKYVFPSARGASRPLSDNGMRTALRTAGFDNETMTPHGFRAMARTLLDEQLRERIDLIEHQLGHTVKDALGRAYNRTKHLEARAEMMQRWADFLDNLRSPTHGENVIQLKQRIQA